MSIRKFSIGLALLAILVATLACGAPTGPSATNFRMTTDEDGKNTTTTYSPDQAFNVFFDVSGIDPGTQFEAKWYAVNVEGFDSSEPLKVTDYAYEEGVSSVYFQLTYSDNWPSGTYRVEVYMAGTKIGEEQFSVE
jgi:hypothetical protein